jgi:ABC-type multidrug transport system fused ATPase/permease subunit
LDFVASLPNGIDTPIGERGVNLSGGQRQRLGIARAMYTKPKLLIFDEATSSLDGLTENDITNAIYDSALNLTRIIIAHRLSTVVHADQVIYLSNGKILASGNFHEVREKIPDFDKSAKLMGL